MCWIGKELLLHKVQTRLHWIVGLPTFTSPCTIFSSSSLHLCLVADWNIKMSCLFLHPYFHNAATKYYFKYQPLPPLFWGSRKCTQGASPVKPETTKKCKCWNAKLPWIQSGKHILGKQLCPEYAILWRVGTITMWDIGPFCGLLLW